MKPRQQFLRLGKSAFFIAASLVGAANAGNLSLDVPNARLFDKSEKLYTANELVAGNIEYITDKNSEGYHPKKLIAVNGRLLKKVYDHPANTSALLIFSDMRSELQRKRFEIIHECDGEVCGDLDAWRLYLSPCIAGSVSSQHYILAKRVDRSSTQYIQFYAVDIGAKPRSVLSLVSEFSPPSLGLTINLGPSRSRTVNGAIAEDISQIRFKPSSSELNDSDKEIIKKIANKIRSEKINQIELIGYTDNRGDEKANQRLAEQRAEAVARELKAQFGLDALRVISVGRGEAEPLASNGASEGRALNRRVSVKYHDDVALMNVGASNTSP